MQCPKCGGDIFDKGRFLACEKNVYKDPTSCNFVVWKDGLKALGLEMLDDDQLASLIQGELIPLELISHKSGSPKPFTCEGQLKEVDGRWKIDFVFPERSTKKFGDS